jgi:hypothetical protein
MKAGIYGFGIFGLLEGKKGCFQGYNFSWKSWVFGQIEQHLGFVGRRLMVCG